MKRNSMKAGAALAMAAAAVSAQSLNSAGSDPVTVGRAGTGVAYGRSLEAAGLNPALLVTLSEARSGHVALGLDSQASFTTLQANQAKAYSSDRNNFAGGFGAAWVLRPGLAFGLRADQPYRRSIELPRSSGARFLGDRFSLSSQRMEFQAAFSPEGRPEWSFGAAVGLMKVDLELGSTLRAAVPVDPTQPLGPGNPVRDLAEFGLRERGSKTVPTFTLGLRWALSTRWTLGASFESGVKAEVISEAARHGDRVLYDQDGTSAPTAGAAGRAEVLFANSAVRPGGGELRLPPRITLGLRHRVNQLFTWEADFRWNLQGAAFPTFASLQTPSGQVAAPQSLKEGKGTQGLMLMGEFALGKLWTARIGAGLESASQRQEDSSPLVASGAQSIFGFGAGYKLWGGELNFGYQYRNPRKQDRSDLAGQWGATGYRSVGSVMRIEGVGHLGVIGYRRTF